MARGDVDYSGACPHRILVLAGCGPAIAASVTHRLAKGNASWPRTLGASALGVLPIVAAFVIFSRHGDCGRLEAQLEYPSTAGLRGRGN